VKSKIGPKISLKISKMKNIVAQQGDDSTQKDSYTNANQGFTRCGIYLDILPLFGRLGRSLTSLLSSLRHEAHPHLAKTENLRQSGWKRDTSHNSPMVLFIAKIKRLECPYGLK
jgi:hypothetical protein